MVLFFVLHLGMTFYPKLNQNTPNTLMLDSLTQQKVDSLIVIKSAVKKDTIYPFNPNYISDFKAYQLDIPIKAVNRIRAFRTAGKFINSIEVFKEVTMLSRFVIKFLNAIEWTVCVSHAPKIPENGNDTPTPAMVDSCKKLRLFIQSILSMWKISKFKKVAILPYHAFQNICKLFVSPFKYGPFQYVSQQSIYHGVFYGYL